jgi:glycosyltransferase involved in cell wall biosynthesis
MAEPLLSIILPAHDEEALIGEAVRSACEAASALAEPFEVIVVNDASTDRTGEIARGLGARVIDVNRRQIAAVRNDGAAAARGRWLVFMDADTRMTPEILAAACGALRQGAVGGGSAVRFDGEIPLYARLLMRVLVPAFRLTRTAAGCFMFATRDAFDAIGGFDPALFASEEVAFSKAMKKRGRFVILREAVTTSGRKVRQYTGLQLLGALLRQAMKGPRKAWRTREGLDIWYNAPRETPGGTAGQPRE